MFFTINGVATFRFKRPSFWFIWFIQKPVFCLIIFLLSIAAFIWALVLSIVSALVFINDIRDPSGDQPSSLATIGAIVLVLLFGWLFSKAYDSIHRKRRAISQGNYRDFYVVQDDFSYQIIFISNVQKSGRIPNEALHHLFADRSVIESDKRIRDLGLDMPEELRFRRQEQKRILHLIQGFYLQNNFWNYGVLEEIQEIHGSVDAMANHLAHDLLDKYNGRRESLMELIRETQTEA